ncbi:RNA polymerase sigma factor [Segetibacter aerophilus]|uniref:RNA polymerase sigma-70 region 2 domain-containing protein n=1 Tax=Segetibacter aerophilus TaxID=670293 RepID=A0A512B859_9BACT|nr:hypothetical protein [Segetibacter aerophilus]GEO08143.1 hypothetical protein SAE01_06390 [Segetibacter aerophilus]
MALKQKDQKAFSYLYDQYAPSIYGVLVREVKNEQLAAEILKRTFINIIEECNNMDCIKQSLFVWLLMMTKKMAASSFNVNINLSGSLMAKTNVGQNINSKASSSYFPAGQFVSPL